MSKKNKNAGNIAFGVLLGFAGLFAAIELVWPMLPRPTYLSQGCSMTTSGTVASVFGTIYAGLVKLLTTGSFAVTAFWLGYLLVSMFKHIGTWLWMFKQWLTRPKQPKQPKQPKPKPKEDYKRTNIKYTNDFNNLFQHRGLDFWQRRFRGVLYKYLYDPVNFYLNVTVALVFAGLGLAFLTSPYVCHETGTQTFAFLVTIASITIVTEIVLIYAWGAVYPTASTRNAFVRRYGDLQAFWSGCGYSSAASNFAILDYVGHKSTDCNMHMQDSIFRSFRAKVLPEMYENKIFSRYLSYAHVADDRRISVRFEFTGEPGTTLHGKHVAFIAEYHDGLLVVGKSFRTLYKIQTGVKIVVSEQLPLGKFAEGVASVLAWLINNDDEVRECVNKRPIMAPGLILNETERPPQPGPNQIKRSRVTPKPPPAQPSKKLKKRRK